MKNPRQQGISLLEILMSLGLIAIILTIAVNYFYSQNKLYLAVSKAATQIQQLAGVSYEWQTAQAQDTFQNISQEALQAAGLLTASDTYAQIDPWGGHITVTADSDDPHYVFISLPSVPRDACVNLRNRMTSIAHRQASSGECESGNYYISL